MRESSVPSQTPSAETPLFLSESRAATAETVGWARERIGVMAASGGADARQVEDVRLLISEAVSNAVVHAYGDSGGEVHVMAAVVSGELWVVISDDGRGMRPDAETGGLGLGLALMARLSDEVTIGARSSGGVEVRMRFDLAPKG